MNSDIKVFKIPIPKKNVLKNSKYLNNKKHSKSQKSAKNFLKKNWGKWMNIFEILKNLNFYVGVIRILQKKIYNAKIKNCRKNQNVQKFRKRIRDAYFVFKMFVFVIFYAGVGGCSPEENPV